MKTPALALPLLAAGWKQVDRYTSLCGIRLPEPPLFRSPHSGKVFPLSEALSRHRARQIAIIAGAAMMQVVASKVIRHMAMYRARLERETAEKEVAMFV